MTSMTSPSDNPDFVDLVEDLRQLRLQGLVRLRHLRLTSLEYRASAPELRSVTMPSAVEAMLRRAVEALGPGSLGEAAAFTFGLAQGTRDWPAQDRRRRAAEVYGVSVERFRKYHERTVFEQVAEQILSITRPTGPSGPTGPPDPATGRDAEPVPCPAAVSSAPGPPGVPAGARIELVHPARGGDVPVTLHVVTVELLTGIDVLVGPVNVYLEPSKTYSSTVAGRLRAAAARRDAAGRIVDDVVLRELHAWRDRHGSNGVAVVPGTVVPTDPGALADQGVRRLYHAAVAVPLPSGNAYHVAPEAVVRAVREVFALARSERDRGGLPLTSLCFPLIGAGRGGMPAAQSAEVLWWALREELTRDPDWGVHLVARTPARASLLLAHLLGSGLREA